jgi:hypothetical protein
MDIILGSHHFRNSWNISTKYIVLYFCTKVHNTLDFFDEESFMSSFFLVFMMLTVERNSFCWQNRDLAVNLGLFKYLLKKVIVY